MKNNINIIDVGCRYGIHHLWEGINEVQYVGFDPDEKEIKRLQQKYNKHNQYRFYPYALSDIINPDISLNILKHKGQSSLHRPNRKSFWFNKTRDGEGEISENIKCATITLDSFCKTNKIVVDFLKVDTEGHDYYVLKGAENEMSNILGINCETQFEKVFNDSKLFPEIHNYLMGKGFFLLNFNYEGRGSALSYFSTFKKYGVLSTTDACYVKNFQLLKEEKTDFYSSVIKLAIYLILNNASDVALYLLEFANENGMKFPLKESKLENILEKQFCYVAYKLKLVPGNSFNRAKTDYKKYFGKEFPDMHLFYESEFLNPC